MFIWELNYQINRQPNPSKRPGFEDINNRLDYIIINAAISDEQGRRFWEENFIRKEDVDWDEFVPALYRYVGNLIKTTMIEITITKKSDLATHLKVLAN